MSRASSRRPSPALVISLLALFVALGGSAYAATKIGTKDIKANAITTGKIKKNAVTTAKIKKDAVTGAKIKESSLGAVPNATNAVNATNATNFSRYFTSGLKKSTVGSAPIELGSIGPFTFVGKCEKGPIGEEGKIFAQIYMKNAISGSFAYNYETAVYSGGELLAGDEPQIADGVYTEGSEWGGYSPSYSSFSAANASGSVLIEGGANSGVRVFGADCAFNVWWLNNA